MVVLMLVGALIVAGLFFFVPQVHRALIGALKTAADDLDKINTDAKALVSRLEGHAAAQTSASADHTKAAAVFVAAAATAQTNAETARKAADAFKAAVAEVRKV